MSESSRLESLRAPGMPPRPLLALFTLWLVVFAASGQIVLIAPILPRIAEQLHTEEGHLGWLVTAYAVALGLFTLLAGPVSDRFGRRRMLLGGTAAMAGALALHGLASDFGSLLAVRTVAGAAGGLLSGAAVAYVGDAFPSNRRGWANGIVMSGFAAGQIVGIPIGTLMAADWGFRAPFLAFAVVMAGACVLAAFALPQPPGARAEGRLTLGSAVAAYRLLLKGRETAAAALVYLCLFFGIGVFVIFFPTWLERELGFTPRAVALLYVFGGVANVLSGPQAGKLSDRIGRKPVVVAASLGMGVLMMATPLTKLYPPSAYALFFVVMALAAARISPMQALLTELVPAASRGAFMSLTVAVGQIGFAVGSALSGPIFTGPGFFVNALAGGLMAFLVAGLVWQALPGGTPQALPSPADRPADGALAGPEPTTSPIVEAAQPAAVRAR